jgi:hypothetical protein
MLRDSIMRATDVVGEMDGVLSLLYHGGMAFSHYNVSWSSIE